MDPLTSGQAPQTFAIEFRGKPGEYFRIWFVNTVLTILTLGIYSAWAKVRTRRYFYNNTLIQGSSFDYHADPVRILKGRIILALFFGCYVSTQFFKPLWIVVLLGVIFLPYLLVRGMIFSLNNTSFRGIRFGFEKNYADAYRTYGFGALFTILTLGFASIWFPFWHHRFELNNMRLGNTRAKFDGGAGEYGLIYLRGFLRALGLWLLLGLVSAMFYYGFKNVMSGLLVKFALIPLIIAVYCIVGIVSTYIRAGVGNFFWAHTRLGTFTFYSDYDTFDMFSIYLGNLIACLFTLGLAFPWAQIQLAKYHAAHTFLKGRPENFDSFTQGNMITGQGAVGDNLLDFWDIDLGF